ncbi:uncharacterized protein LTR77_005235 [Saxophila tyrrhenica]|uniref:Rhodopsin domain-containing protein n=1 Tax=Saxophila tyrrhenica TaxID=1690608 RepID=A0AAV9PBE3_9PEZI|nr:hypothetical protein LTR77_005235 [Saxophila tyrrhenica]
MPQDTYIEGIRYATISPDDHGAVLQIIAWLMMVVMILATTLRLMIRFTTNHIPGFDDAFVSLATLSGIGEVIAISIAVNQGLGRRSELLDEKNVQSIEKVSRNGQMTGQNLSAELMQNIYTSTILYILTVALAKASTLLLISRLATAKLHLRTVQALSAIVIAWTLAASFGSAFACQMPRPWNFQSGRCFDIATFWYIMGAVDIAGDLALIMLPGWVVWDLRMHWGPRLVFLRQWQMSDDLTYPIAYHMATTCQTTLAVIVACIPALKPFMDRAASGLMSVYERTFFFSYFVLFMGVSLSDRHGTYTLSEDYRMQPLSKRSDGTPRGSNFRSDGSDHQTFIVSAASKKPDEGDDGSEEGIIQKTTDWNVRYSDPDSARRHAATEDADEVASPDGARGHTVL